MVAKKSTTIVKSFNVYGWPVNLLRVQCTRCGGMFNVEHHIWVPRMAPRLATAEEIAKWEAEAEEERQFYYQEYECDDCRLR